MKSGCLDAIRVVAENELAFQVLKGSIMKPIRPVE